MTSAPLSSPKLNPRNAGIDSLRGLAIVLVILNHVAIRLPLTKTSLADFLPDGVLRFITHQGYHSVFAFFVMSGFLIASGIIRRWGSLGQNQLPSFYARRFARIVPCLVVLLSVLMVLDAMGAEGFVINRADQTLTAALCSALGMYLNKYECLTGYLPANWDVLWSLSIEEMFYLVFPIICLSLPRSEKRQIVLFGVAACALPFAMHAMAGEPSICRHKAYLPGASALSAGVAAALLARSGWIKWLWVPVLGWSGAAVLLLTCVLPFFVPPSVSDDLTLGLILSVAALLIAFSKGWGRLFQHTAFVWLRSFGLMSYEVYLTHMFFVLCLVQAYQGAGFSERAAWVCFPVALGGAWLLGYGTDRFLSYPAERRMKRLFQRFYPAKGSTS